MLELKQFFKYFFRTFVNLVILVQAFQMTQIILNPCSAKYDIFNSISISYSANEKQNSCLI